MADTDMAIRIKGYERPISRVARCLGVSGLKVVRSFDLQSSRIAMGGIICECPHHGTRDCDCQVAVLLVYGENGTPATLLMHGRDRKTKFSLVNTPQNPVEPGLEALIISTLAHEQIPLSAKYS